MIKSFVRTVRNVIIIAILVIVGYEVGDYFIDLDDIIGGGCDTELCCDDCDTVAITRIIDGDTVRSPLGQIRIYGADTPEVGQRCSQEATDMMRQLAGNAVRVESGSREKDPFERLLFYLYTKDGESIDEVLLREGLAVAWMKDGQHRHYLSNVEAQARENRVGCLWK